MVASILVFGRLVFRPKYVLYSNWAVVDCHNAESPKQPTCCAAGFVPKRQTASNQFVTSDTQHTPLTHFQEGKVQAAMLILPANSTAQANGQELGPNIHVHVTNFHRAFLIRLGRVEFALTHFFISFTVHRPPMGSPHCRLYFEPASTVQHSGKP